MEIEKIIDEVVTEQIVTLERLKEQGVKTSYSFPIDCKELADYNAVDIRDSQAFKEHFIKLMSMKGPVLYWFEIISDTNRGEIRSAIEQYAMTNNAKATPALKKYVNLTSKCLYVGKVKRNFWGRVIQHLGFYKVGATQGLQLYYWAKELDLKLKLHSYEFEHEMNDLIALFELELAKRKDPIIGKHS